MPLTLQRMSVTESAKRERRVVQALFVLVLITFWGAERARTLLYSGRPAAQEPTAARTATGAVAVPVAFQR